MHRNAIDCEVLTGTERNIHSPAEKAERHYYLKIYRRGMWLLFFNQSFETF
jgi:hypothetical protein